MNSHEIIEGIYFLLGIDDRPNWVSLMQFSLRAVVIFVLTLAIVRFGPRRMLSKNAPFDAVLVVLLGSTISRAINGKAPFVETVFISFVLLLLHWLLTLLGNHYHIIGTIIKGRRIVLVENGKIVHAGLRKSHISKRDLFEEIRSNGNTTALNDIKIAILERNGEISVIRKNK